LKYRKTCVDQPFVNKRKGDKGRGKWKWSKWEGMDEMKMKGVSCKGQREKGEGGIGKRSLDGRRRGQENGQ
jgi:hypothetical protein